MDSKKQCRSLKLMPLVLGLGILISPDTLVRLGDFMGNTGWTGLAVLTVATALFLLLAPALEKQQAVRKKPGVNTFFPLILKFSATLFLSTGVLVSSGFVFNEVFIYWFPNFGFAFTLLALVLGIHLAGIQAALKAQVVFVSLTLICLLSLIIPGLAAPGSTAPAFPDQMPGLSVFFVPLLLWVGVDLGALSPGSGKTGYHKISNALGVTITLAGIIFLLWGVVSILQVPLGKLSGSSIPHLKTARAIMGDQGRYLMGAVIIFGSLSGVNALFTACRMTAAGIAGSGFLPRGIDRYVPFVLAAGTGLMMAMGLAGGENLEIWIQAVFILWLLSYSGIFSGHRKISPAAILIYTGSAMLLFSGEAWQLKTVYFLVILITAWIPGVLLSLKSSFRKK